MRGNEVAGSFAPGAAGALLGLRSQYTIFRKKHERLGKKSGEAEAREILDHEYEHRGRIQEEERPREALHKEYGGGNLMQGAVRNGGWDRVELFRGRGVQTATQCVL